MDRATAAVRSSKYKPRFEVAVVSAARLIYSIGAVIDKVTQLVLSDTGVVCTSHNTRCWVWRCTWTLLVLREADLIDCDVTCNHGNTYRHSFTKREPVYSSRSLTQCTADTSLKHKLEVYVDLDIWIISHIDVGLLPVAALVSLHLPELDEGLVVGFDVEREASLLGSLHVVVERHTSLRREGPELGHEPAGDVDSYQHHYP